jgi:hypothetical protein
LDRYGNEFNIESRPKQAGLLVTAIILAVPVLAIAGALLGGIFLSVFMPVIRAFLESYTMFNSFYLQKGTPSLHFGVLIKYIAGYVVGSSVIAAYIHYNYYRDRDGKMSDSILGSMMTAGLFVLLIRISKFVVSAEMYKEMTGVLVGAYYILPFMMIAIASKRSFMSEDSEKGLIDVLGGYRHDKEYFRQNPFSSFFIHITEHIAIIVASLGVLVGLALLGLLYEYTVAVYPVNEIMTAIGLILIFGFVHSGVKAAELR